MRPRSRAVFLAGGCALACATTNWNVSALEEGFPALAGIGSHQLGAATPYVLPSRGVLTLFLCRWLRGPAIPVSLPPDATAEERKLLETALGAWEGAGLGIRFAIGEPPARGIEIRFASGAETETEPQPETPQAGITFADCAVDPEALANPPGPILPARIVFATVRLQRDGRDMLGRRVAHTPEELIGTALHELGHALGFQGHPRRGDTIMNASVDSVRRIGRRVNAGGHFTDSTLRALYSVSSGAVVRRVTVSPGQTASVDRMARAARRLALSGPILRVGDRAARLDWRDSGGRVYPLLIPGIPELLRVPETLRVHTPRSTAGLLSSVFPLP